MPGVLHRDIPYTLIHEPRVDTTSIVIVPVASTPQPSGPGDADVARLNVLQPGGSDQHGVTYWDDTWKGLVRTKMNNLHATEVADAGYGEVLIGQTYLKVDAGKSHGPTAAYADRINHLLTQGNLVAGSNVAEVGAHMFGQTSGAVHSEYLRVKKGVVLGEDVISGQVDIDGKTYLNHRVYTDIIWDDTANNFQFLGYGDGTGPNTYNVISQLNLGASRLINVGNTTDLTHITTANPTGVIRVDSASGQHVMWDSGNDGHLSGLDADTLDGYHYQDILNNVRPDAIWFAQAIPKVRAHAAITEHYQQSQFNQKIVTRNDIQMQSKNNPALGISVIINTGTAANTDEKVIFFSAGDLRLSHNALNPGKMVYLAGSASVARENFLHGPWSYVSTSPNHYISDFAGGTNPNFVSLGPFDHDIIINSSTGGGGDGSYTIWVEHYIGSGNPAGTTGSGPNNNGGWSQLTRCSSFAGISTIIPAKLKFFMRHDSNPFSGPTTFIHSIRAFGRL